MTADHSHMIVGRGERCHPDAQGNVWHLDETQLGLTSVSTHPCQPEHSDVFTLFTKRESPERVLNRRRLDLARPDETQEAATSNWQSSKSSGGVCVGKSQLKFHEGTAPDKCEM